VQSLLEDRFRLVARKEQRVMSINELLLDRNDGRLGPNLIKLSSELDCQAARIQAAKNPSTKPVPGTMPALMIRGCGSMSAIAGDLYPVARTFVIDKTGLSGEWYLSLRFAADPLDDRLRGTAASTRPGPAIVRRGVEGTGWTNAATDSRASGCARDRVDSTANRELAWGRLC
jgi:uncharacterized protein (TIGR03435 family)